MSDIKRSNDEFQIATLIPWSYSQEEYSQHQHSDNACANQYILIEDAINAIIVGISQATLDCVLGRDCRIVFISHRSYTLAVVNPQARLWTEGYPRARDAWEGGRQQQEWYRRLWEGFC